MTNQNRIRFYNRLRREAWDNPALETFKIAAMIYAVFLVVMLCGESLIRFVMV